MVNYQLSNLLIQNIYLEFLIISFTEFAKYKLLNISAISPDNICSLFKLPPLIATNFQIKLKKNTIVNYFKRSVDIRTF